MVNSQPLKDKVGPKVKLVKSVAYNAQYVGALTYHEAKERGGGIGSYHKVPKRNEH